MAHTVVQRMGVAGGVGSVGSVGVGRSSVNLGASPFSTFEGLKGGRSVEQQVVQQQQQLPSGSSHPGSLSVRAVAAVRGPPLSPSCNCRRFRHLRRQFRRFS